jgi:hypothetical protein
VTSVARTLLDLAEVLSLRQLRYAIEQTERLRLFDLRALQRLMARSHGRRGLKPLKLLLAENIEPPDARNILERVFLDICRAAGFPEPALNVVVAGYCVDAFWPHAGLIVELDGRETHEIWAQAEADRIRDAELQAAGYRVIRLTYRRVTNAPDEVVALLQQFLSQAA